MEKRGQFYIMGAFAIIIIVSGLIYIYTSIKTFDSGTSISDLADEAYYETKQLIENRIIMGIGEDIMMENVRNIMKYYADRYTYADIGVIYGNETLVHVINATSVKDIVPIEKKIDATLRGSTRTFEMKSWKNLFVMAVGEKNGEKSVIVR